MYTGLSEYCQITSALAALAVESRSRGLELMTTHDVTTSQVLLLTTGPALDGLQHALQARGYAAARVDLTAARELLATRRDRCVAVVEAHPSSSYAFAEAWSLLHEHPVVPSLLLYSDGWDPARYLDAHDGESLMEAVRLPAPLDAVALHVQALLLHAGFHLADAGDPRPGADAGAPRLHQGQLIVVYSPKGGVGRTFVATNLAVGLARYYGVDVALLDAHLWFGDVGVMLDLRSPKTFASLVDATDQLDLDALREVLVPHPSGVKVLLAPGPMEVETIPPGLPARVASAYRTLFDYVVVDTSSALTDHTVELLDIADRILLLTTPEMSAIHNLVELLRLAPIVGWSHKVSLVVNRANTSMDIGQVEKALQMPVDATIISAGPRVVETTNQGQPIVLLDPPDEEPITRDLHRLIAHFAGRPEPQGANGPPAGHWPWVHWSLPGRRTAGPAQSPLGTHH